VRVVDLGGDEFVEAGECEHDFCFSIRSFRQELGERLGQAVPLAVTQAPEERAEVAEHVLGDQPGHVDGEHVIAVAAQPVQGLVQEGGIVDDPDR
jgi:hypothetical protein